MTFEEWRRRPGNELLSRDELSARAWEAATLAERLACASVCDELAEMISGGANWTGLGSAEECADSIRERSNK